MSHVSGVSGYEYQPTKSYGSQQDERITDAIAQMEGFIQSLKSDSHGDLSGDPYSYAFVGKYLMELRDDRNIDPEISKEAGALYDQLSNSQVFQPLGAHVYVRDAADAQSILNGIEALAKL